MQKLEIFGANRLKGQIKISGSKNASLPILAATLLTKKKIFLKNLPQVKDIHTMISLLQSLGSVISFKREKLVINNLNQKKICLVQFSKNYACWNISFRTFAG